MLIANKKLQKHLALFPVKKLDKDNKVRVMKGHRNCQNLLWWKHPTQTLTKFSSVRTRKVWIYKETENQNPILSNPVDIAIRKLPSSVQAIKYKLSKCSAIKHNISVNKDFHFSNTEVSVILKETTAFNDKKNGTFGNIPTKLLKEVWYLRNIIKWHLE